MKWISVDLETTNNHKGSASYAHLNRVVCYVCVDCNNNVTKRWGHDGLVELLNQYDLVIAHNAKFELKWLLHLGQDIFKFEVFDTMIAEYTLLGNRRAPLDLGSVAKRYGYKGKEPYIDRLMKDGVCPSEMPQSMLMQRCYEDTLLAARLYPRMLKKLKKQGKYNIFKTRMRLCPVLADIELQGMWLDKDKVVEEYERTNKEFVKVMQEIEEFTGGINQNSPPQRAEFLYDTLGFEEVRNSRGEPVRTPAGARKTDVAVLSKLVPKTERQAEYLRLTALHSQLNADVTKALDKLRECVEAGETLYADFNQTVTQTGRLSSSGTKYKIQLQNMARKFKPLFTARREGWQVKEVDASQAEFRAAAFMAQDQQAIQDIINEEDVHTVTMDAINGAGGSVDRTGAKPHTFKPLNIAA